MAVDIKEDNRTRIIPIDKPTHCRVIVPALEVVHTDLIIVVIPAITIRIDGGDGAVGSIACYCADAPGIIAIFCDGMRVLVHDADDVALEVLLEIERLIVIENAADAVLVVVQRNKRNCLCTSKHRLWGQSAMLAGMIPILVLTNSALNLCSYFYTFSQISLKFFSKIIFKHIINYLT